MRIASKPSVKADRVFSTFLGGIFYFSGSILVSNFILVLREVFSARLLGPIAYGGWHLLRLVLGYTRYSDLGVLLGMSRQLPYYLGKNEEDRAQVHIRDVSSTTAIVSSISVGVLSGCILWRQYEAVSLSVAIFFCLLVVTQQIHLFLALLQIAYGKLAQRGRQEIIASITGLLLVLLLFKQGLTGITVAVALSFALSSVYVIYKIGLVFRIRLAIGEFVQLVRTGFPMVIDGLLSLSFRSIDRVYVIIFFDQQALGHYGIAFTAYSFFGTIFASISNALIPKFSKLYGSTESVQSLKNLLIKALTVLCYLAPLPIGILYLMLEFPISRFLPNYIPAIAPTKVTLLSSFFLGVISCLRPFFIAILHTPKVNLLQLFFVLLSAALYPLIHSIGFGLVGISLGYLISFGAYATALLLLAKWELVLECKGMLLLTKIYLPFIYLVVLVLSIERLVPFSPDAALRVVIERCLLFIALNLPLVLYLEKQTGLVNRLWILFVRK